MSSPASAHTGTSLFGPSPVAGAGLTATVTPQKVPGTAIKDARSKSFAPTAKDSLFMLTIVMLNKDPVNVDWDQVADELGFKNASVAKVCFFSSSSCPFIPPSHLPSRLLNTLCSVRTAPLPVRTALLPVRTAPLPVRTAHPPS